MARSWSGPAVGVQALSPSMKNTMPPETASILTSAALSPQGRPDGDSGFIT
jgi:hypothetical protein